MPYITNGRKIELRDGAKLETPGDLNYVLTTVAIRYIKSQGLRYEHINEVVETFELVLAATQIPLQFRATPGITRRLETPYNVFELEELIGVLVEEFRKQGNSQGFRGALRCAQMEFYRRVAAPYEDKKIQENGDVYPDDLTGEE